MRIAVDTTGVITACGDCAATWRALLDGRSAIAPLRSFRAPPLGDADAAEVAPLDEALRTRDRKREKLQSPAARLAVAAARAACADRAPLDGSAAERHGVFLGVGVSGGDVADVAGLLDAAIVDGRVDPERLGAAGLARVHPLLSFQVLTNMPVCHVAMELGLGGEGQARLSTGVETLAAIGEAADAIAAGRLDGALAGGADAPVNVVTYAQLVGAGRVGRARPWAGPLAAARDGARLGEGAAILGLARSGDAAIALAAVEVGVDLAEVVRLAISRAEIAPSAISHAWLGASGHSDDAIEARAVAAVLPDAAWVVPKAVVGETVAAGPAIAAALAARSLGDGIAPPWPAWIEVDPAIARPRARAVGEAAIVTAVDGSGAACALLVRR